MRKILLLSIFIKISTCCYGTADSTSFHFERKLSIGFELVPVAYSKWNFPHAESVSSYRAASDPAKDYTNQINPVPILGVNVKYALTPHCLVSAGVYNEEEKIVGIFLKDHLTDSTQIIKYTGYYLCKYISIPIAVELHLCDNTEKRSYTNFHISFNFDFVYYDKSNGDSEIIDSNGNRVESSPLGKKEHAISNSFNRIAPAIYIGRERFNKKGTFSFTYGSMFTFPAIYQNNTALLYYKNYRISPCVVGCSYHF